MAEEQKVRRNEKDLVNVRRETMKAADGKRRDKAGGQIIEPASRREVNDEANGKLGDSLDDEGSSLSDSIDQRREAFENTDAQRRNERKESEVRRHEALEAIKARRTQERLSRSEGENNDEDEDEDEHQTGKIFVI